MKRLDWRIGNRFLSSTSYNVQRGTTAPLLRVPRCTPSSTASTSSRDIPNLPIPLAPADCNGSTKLFSVLGRSRGHVSTRRILWKMAPNTLPTSTLILSSSPVHPTYLPSSVTQYFPTAQCAPRYLNRNTGCGVFHVRSGVVGNTRKIFNSCSPALSHFALPCPLTSFLPSVRSSLYIHVPNTFIPRHATTRVITILHQISRSLSRILFIFVTRHQIYHIHSPFALSVSSAAQITGPSYEFHPNPRKSDSHASEKHRKCIMEACSIVAQQQSHNRRWGIAIFIKGQ